MLVVFCVWWLLQVLSKLLVLCVWRNLCKKALPGELYLRKRSVSCILWHASREPR